MRWGTLSSNLLIRPVNDLNSMKLYLRDVRAAARTRITQRTITHAYVHVKIYLFCRTHVLPVSSTLNLVTDRIGIVPSSFSSLRENRLERREVWLIRLSRRRNRIFHSWDCLCSTMNHLTSLMRVLHLPKNFGPLLFASSTLVSLMVTASRVRVIIDRKNCQQHLCDEFLSGLIIYRSQHMVQWTRN